MPDPAHPGEPVPPEPQPPTDWSGRAYRLASGEDVVLSFDAPNAQFFDCEAICDPVELAKLTRPPE